MMDKVLHILDPLFQGANKASWQNKHGEPAKCLTDGLRTCGEKLGYGWDLNNVDWGLEYHSAMHLRCSREETAVYVYLYWAWFKGEDIARLEAGLTPREVATTRKKMLLQISSSVCNVGEIPAYLLPQSWQ